MSARVIVLAGPSGAGKSRLAARLGFPVLRLDDFYREAGDPALPLISTGANAGIVDWDHPASWNLPDALAALDELCATGTTQVPHYDIATSSRIGTRTLHLDGAELFVAEGIFAPEIVAACQERGILAGAYCITQHPVVTFWRRLSRDLSERRKSPVVLVRRGVALMKDQRRVVANAVAKGCRPLSGDAAYHEIVHSPAGT